MPATTEATRPPVAPRALLASFEKLASKLSEHRPGDDPELLRRAFAFAAESHKSQKRKTGEPYLSHVLEVAHLLADMRLDGVY